ncbi:MAG: exo-alpha-sialidase [Caulobacter sp.]|nr:exo-alpha-sialidase [Caulobacter sp.]
MNRQIVIGLAAALATLLSACGASPPPLLATPGVKPVADKSEWSGLPRLPVKRGVVFRGRPGVSAFNIHNYLDHDGRQFSIMWTSGAVHEGEAGSRVMRAVSDDGLTWSAPTFLTPPPPPGQRYFARGYWRRGTETLALVSSDREGDYFGPDLRMLAFAPGDRPDQPWTLRGVLANGVITNFPPRRLADGQWFESSRDSAMRPGFIKGGVSSWDSWRRIDVPPPTVRWEWRMWPATPAGRRPPGEAWKSWLRVPLPTRVRPQLDEPIWWTLPDGRLTGLYRDNSGRRLYRAMGSADGEHWTRPRRTNFPDASSKMAGLRLSEGLYVMVSNPRPDAKERSPLVLSVSADGLSFTAMAILLDEPTSRRAFGNRKTPGYQYPQLLEHDGRLLVAYSRNKEDIEVIAVAVSDIEALAKRQRPG